MSALTRFDQLLISLLQQIEDLKGMVKERLNAWREKHNGHLPKNIIFFRDGISESQFEACKTYEVNAVEHAYKELCTEKQKDQLKLTFVVTGKRHNTRFYPRNGSETFLWHKNTNVKPGLFVGDFITDPIGNGSLVESDFYLQSHQAIKGTARSAHYHVLRDDMKFKGKQLPILTHQLCYAFARATKGVSYVSPAYIADRLCERGRVYLRGWKPSQDFNEPKDRNGNATSNEAEVKEWKRNMARAVANSSRWGCYNDDSSKDEIRLNPWHKDLDDTMFWM